MAPADPPEWLRAAPGRFRPVDLVEAPGFADDDLLEFWAVFRASCAHGLETAGFAVDARLRAAAVAALDFAPTSHADVHRWLEAWFVPCQVLTGVFHGVAQPFLTGYFEPETLASRTPRADYPEPARARPVDLLDAPPTDTDHHASASRLLPDGRRAPYWTRAEIDAGRAPAPPVAWMRDAVDLFIAQVQGCARLRFDDGSCARLAYDGKNGRHYVSLGRVLIEQGHVSAEAMSLETLTQTLHRLLADPAVGRSVLHLNPSYVFFRLVEDDTAQTGPVGAQGVPLTPFRSLAVDASIWPLGLPFFVSGVFPWPGEKASFHRMTVAQDTGSAILGPGRCDLFCGGGADAGRLAGLLRHPVDLYALVPRGGA